MRISQEYYEIVYRGKLPLFLSFHHSGYGCIFVYIRKDKPENAHTNKRAWIKYRNTNDMFWFILKIVDLWWLVSPWKYPPTIFMHTFFIHIMWYVYREIDDEKSDYTLYLLQNDIEFNLDFLHTYHSIQWRTEHVYDTKNTRKWRKKSYECCFLPTYLRINVEVEYGFYLS